VKESVFRFGDSFSYWVTQLTLGGSLA
jgi:hypothetical protein